MASLLCPVLLAEIGIRIFAEKPTKLDWSWHLQEFSQKADKSEGLLVPHPVFGFTGNYSKTNNFGFESKENYPWVKQKEQYDLIVLGGSVAVQVFPSIVGLLGESQSVVAWERKCKKKLVPHNLAQGAFKQPQQLFVYQYFLEYFDMAVNIEGVNDSVFDPGPGIPVDFPATTNLLYSMNSERQVLLKKLQRIRSRQVWLVKAQKKILGQLDLVTLILRGLMNSLELRYLQTEKKLEETFPEVVSANFPNGSIRLHELIDRWEKFTKIQYTLAKEYGKKQLFVLQPTQYLPGAKILSETEKDRAISKVSKLAEDRKEGMIELEKRAAFLSQQGLPIRNLQRIFSGVSEDIYTDDCCHLNGKGIAIFAQKIVEEIEKVLPTDCH